MQNKLSTVIPLAVLCSGIALAAYAWYPIASTPTQLANRVVVLKSQHRMLLLRDGREICTYRVALGRNSSGAKTRQGDHRTPEGDYVLDRKNVQSGFHLAMHISYPSSVDRENAARDGVAPGGDVMVHGIKNGFGWIGRLHSLVDWTDGCIALTNNEMDQFAKTVPVGTPIEIRP